MLCSHLSGPYKVALIKHLACNLYLTGLSLLVGGHVAREVVALLEGLAAHQTLERVLRTLPLVAEMP